MKPAFPCPARTSRSGVSFRSHPPHNQSTNCNSTGVYSGVSARGNGNSDTNTDNLGATFLRGVQQTDSDGVVKFDTLFPGHYTGRTTHIHVMVHMNVSSEANGTLLDTTATHVGQMFFDQDLITKVEATKVYAANKQPLTSNAKDGILTEEAKLGDPFMEYVLLGDGVVDGLLAWLAFGVNTTLSKTVSAAATLYDGGGQTNSNTGGPSGPGGPPVGPPTGTTELPVGPVVSSTQSSG